MAIRCPGCGDPMRQLSLDEADAEVDVCDGCGGLWVDWFDGEVRAIATETLRVSDPPPASSEAPPEAKTSADAERGAARNDVAAMGACPRCARQLVPERYAVTTEVASTRVEGRTSVVAGMTGAELLRCEDCMGTFVTRASAEVLSWLSGSDDPPPSQSSAIAVQPLPWERFLALVKRFLGLSS